jgi:nickel/cobalt transporter (NiCoT) family protein
MGIARPRGGKTTLLVMYAGIAAATVGSLMTANAIGRSVALILGLSLTTYVLGLRHGVDADHIAAIDNVTRRLTKEGKGPLTVGAWFSLGHSTIVFALTTAIALSAHQVLAAEPQLAGIGAIAGTGISAVFLWLIGAVNLVSAVQIYRTLKAMRGGRSKGDATVPGVEGFFSKRLGKVFDRVRKPWQIYPIGVLFGLGFDTATEVALFSLSVLAAVGASFSIWTVLILPATFTCGMVLVDTTDGVMMSLAYGWAFLQPMRKIFYNLTVTVGSIIVAFLIGGVEVLQVLSQSMGLKGYFWTWMNGLDFETLGVFVILAFGVTWVVSLTVYRLGHYGKTLPLPAGKSAVSP